jgi:hypothetical protein
VVRGSQGGTERPVKTDPLTSDRTATLGVDSVLDVLDSGASMRYC